MICHYCNQDAKKVGEDYWHCMPCDVQYYKGYINLLCSVNGERYSFQYLYYHSHYKSRILKQGAFGYKVILELKDAPQVTPTNVVEKIKTYLTFS